MATRIIDDSKLNDIAVAIQSKDSGGQMTVDEMPDRIESLSINEEILIPKTITQNGVYNAISDNADGFDVVTVGVPEKNTLDELFADTLEVANIPSATKIVPEMFKNKSNLVDVIMPNVTSIGNSAFQGCKNLALTNLPSGITSIGNSAFQGCKNLALTNLPSGITSIGDNAFRDCTNLALTVLPDGVKSIGVSAFDGCTNLALTVLPDGVKSIGNNAFYKCTNLALTALPDGITSIRDGAFQYCTNLALTVLPDGIMSIGNWAFYNCTSLALTVLPDGITRIGNNAFRDCTSLYVIDLTAFTNPQSIPTLANTNAFHGIPATAQFLVANQEMYDAFTTATNWSAYASKFVIKGI